MSLVSMLGPSPDWIVGVSALELCSRNCSWVENKTLNLYPWDAGTDSGITYTVTIDLAIRIQLEASSIWTFFFSILLVNKFDDESKRKNHAHHFVVSGRSSFTVLRFIGC